MAFRRTRALKIFNMAPSPSLLPCRVPTFLPAIQPVRLSLPIGAQPADLSRGISADQASLDLIPPLRPSNACRMTPVDLKRMIRASQMEAARSRLRVIPRITTSYSELLRICLEESDSHVYAAEEIARSPHESNSVTTSRTESAAVSAADQARLDLISPFRSPNACGMTPEGLKKMIMASQMEAARSRLSAIPRISISHSKLIRICHQESDSDEPEIAHSLHEYKSVIASGIYSAAVSAADKARLDLSPPFRPSNACGMTPVDLKRMIRASQTEAARSRLNFIPRISISRSELLRICLEESDSDESAAAEIAHSLFDSNSVIASGNLVFLNPGEIAKGIQKALPLSPTAQKQRMEELKQMEAKKAEIDKAAVAGVRRELWCGLGFLLAQTLAFFRLTFWELSWDVMEPVCFYATSFSFTAGYYFFLKTSKDPSFEGFFESRFAERQKQLLKDSHFDLNRFDELKRQSRFLTGIAVSDNTRD